MIHNKKDEILSRLFDNVRLVIEFGNIHHY